MSKSNNKARASTHIPCTNITVFMRYKAQLFGCENDWTCGEVKEWNEEMVKFVENQFVHNTYIDIKADLFTTQLEALDE